MRLTTAPATPPTPAAPAVLAGHIDERALATELGRSIKTIRRYRHEGMPCAITRGRMRYYDIEAVRAWLRGEPAPGCRRRA